MVQIRRALLVRVPRARLWDALLNPISLQPCLAGVERFVLVGDLKYLLQILIAVPVVGGRYSGTVWAEHVQPPERFDLKAHGDGPTGRIQADAEIVLSEVDGGTWVAVQIRAKLSGMLRIAASPVAGTVGSMLIDRFFACVEGRLSAEELLSGAG